MFKSLKKLGLAGASAIAYAFLLSAAPPGENRIEVERQSRTDAVVVTKVVLGSAEVESGLYVSSGRVQPVTPVEASDDWLRNVTIHVYNQTDKTIAFGQVTLAFPETGDGSYQSPLRVYNITLGRIPSSVAFSGRTGKAIAQNPSSGAISFAPHQTLLIDVGAYIDRIAAQVDNMPIEKLTNCIVRRGTFYFDDGMKWDPSGYWTPDPAKPGTFNHMGRGYFPGDKLPVWPPGYGK
jgi:hypothetical protein